jgi:chromosome segregation protein
VFIERLRLKGFKSFGGSHELTFSPGFTAIVGPNGSGKSNILDGLRWVLGEGSPNCLRITRQSDLLFQGSISLPTATETEVSLCIREDPKICTIKREFSPETGTSLFVDGMRIRLQDLDDVKRQWHMEGEQFAFIGQGEVAEAIHHRPQQRRSILEALFGIDQYRKKREDANQKLKFASEELARLETLVSELTSRRDEIAAMVTIAEKARRLLDELDEKRRGYYFSRRAFLERELYSFQSRIHALERRKNRAAEWETIWKEGLSFYQSLFNSYEQQKKVHEERTESLGFQRETLRRQCFATALTVKSARERLIAQKEEKRHVEEVLSKVDEEATLARGTSYSLTQNLHKKKEEVSALWQKLSNLRSSLRAERQRRQEYGNEYARVEG